jgi:hypothetical protein
MFIIHMTRAPESNFMGTLLSMMARPTTGSCQVEETHIAGGVQCPVYPWIRGPRQLPRFYGGHLGVRRLLSKPCRTDGILNGKDFHNELKKYG